jgi:hypothetical protein
MIEHFLNRRLETVTRGGVCSGAQHSQQEQPQAPAIQQTGHQRDINVKPVAYDRGKKHLQLEELTAYHKYICTTVISIALIASVFSKF